MEAIFFQDVVILVPTLTGRRNRNETCTLDVADSWRDLLPAPRGKTRKSGSCFRDNGQTKH